MVDRARIERIRQGLASGAFDSVPAPTPVDLELSDNLELSADDLELAGRLDWSPKKNWVENEGGLPKYIEDVALALIRGGMSRSRAIATAISQIKKWIASPDTKPDTKAKAVAAIAQWEKMKASARLKRAAK